MRRFQLPFLIAFLTATLFVVGCGEQRDSRLSDADIAYLKQQRLMQMYGGTVTTITSTTVQYVTIPSVQTVITTH